MKTAKLLSLITAIGISSTGFTQQHNNQNLKTMTAEQVKQQSLGAWKSIAPEVRPSSSKNADGTLKPFYLSRTFTFLTGDKFGLEITTFADPNGKVPLAKMELKGHVEWKGDHPLTPGAQKVNFFADESYVLTPLLQGFADGMNQLAKDGYETWEVNKPQSIFKKAFVPFSLAEGQVFAEYDLIYIYNDMMFWGARNIDGRGFDKEENRPTNLQIPMVRQK